MWQALEDACIAILAYQQQQMWLDMTIDVREAVRGDRTHIEAIRSLGYLANSVPFSKMRLIYISDIEVEILYGLVTDIEKIIVHFLRLPERVTVPLKDDEVTRHNGILCRNSKLDPQRKDTYKHIELVEDIIIDTFQIRDWEEHQDAILSSDKSRDHSIFTQ